MSRRSEVPKAKTAWRGWFGLCLALLALAAAEAPVVAQDEPTAEQLLARVQAFYDQTRTVQARFQQTYYLRLYVRYERSS